MTTTSWSRGSTARPTLGVPKGVLIYLAGPLFSEAERRFNLELTYRLEAIGFEVFLPQRDGVERDRPPYDAMTPVERRRAMFEFDRGRILDADVFLFVLDGRVPDEEAPAERRETPPETPHRHPGGLYRGETEPDGACASRLHCRR
jgi:hypothetical protein